MHQDSPRDAARFDFASVFFFLPARLRPDAGRAGFLSGRKKGESGHSGDRRRARRGEPYVVCRRAGPPACLAPSVALPDAGTTAIARVGVIRRAPRANGILSADAFRRARASRVCVGEKWSACSRKEAFPAPANFRVSPQTWSRSRGRRPFRFGPSRMMECGGRSFHSREIACCTSHRA